jgi:CDP-diacylglycerol--serine O-phosphatidyltransferase
MKKHIPNAITCLNLLSGCLGIVLAFNGSLVLSCYTIIIAAIFDFFDGLAARVLNAYSPMGKELDSLADMVSFGFLPAAIVYQLFLQSFDPASGSAYITYVAFLIAVASALRLANFNIDERQTENFIGLPTPANAMLIASFPLIISEGGALSVIILNTYFLAGFSVVSSFLLIMELPLISLKFKNLGIADNLYRYILLFSGIILILIFKFAAVPIILFLYILLSIIQFRIIK